MGALDQADFAAWASRARPLVVEELLRLVAIPSVTPNEHLCLGPLEAALRELGLTTRREALHPGLTADPNFTDHELSVVGPERHNLRAELRGGGRNARTLAFSAHLDVVPAAHQDTAAFDPRFDGERVHGRGACDTKNNIVMLLTALRFLADSGLNPAADVLVDLVIEEEIGGNGTLSTLLHGLQADAVVVLEPTELAVYRGHRGCLTFQVDVVGRSVHMGSDATGVSAIDAAYEVIGALKGLEQRLLAEAREDPAFAAWPRPVQVNVGMIHGGEWSGSVPECCRIRGDVGFLPRYSLDDARRLVSDAVAAVDDPWIREHSTVGFDGLHNAAYLSEHAAATAERLAAAVGRQGGRPRERPAGWNVSCDARLHHHVGGLPTVIFGSGSLDHAHSAHEHVEVAEVMLGAAALADFLLTA